MADRDEIILRTAYAAAVPLGARLNLLHVHVSAGITLCNQKYAQFTMGAEIERVLRDLETRSAKYSAIVSAYRSSLMPKNILQVGPLLWGSISELITDLPAQCAVLSKAQMVRIRKMRPRISRASWRQNRTYSRLRMQRGAGKVRTVLSIAPLGLARLATRAAVLALA